MLAANRNYPILPSKSCSIFPVKLQVKSRHEGTGRMIKRGGNFFLLMPEDWNTIRERRKIQTKGMK